MNLLDARELSRCIIETMRPYCDRVEVAGSIRREKPEVKDIEIVAVPKWEETSDPTDLFGEMLTKTNLLHSCWATPLVPGSIGTAGALGIQWIKTGTDVITPWRIQPEGRYWRGYIAAHRIKLDLFLATPDNFGAVYLIRTGNADFSQAVVTFAHRVFCKFTDGQFTRHGQVLSVPEEVDVFDALGLMMPEPKDRNGVGALKGKSREGNHSA